jgi:hypothetical protein
MAGPGRQSASQIQQAADGAAMEGIAATSQVATVWQANYGPVSDHLDNLNSKQFLEGNLGKHLYK